jgi:hypothetical protein
VVGKRPPSLRRIRAVDVVGARTSLEAGEVGDLVRAGYPPDGPISGNNAVSSSWQKPRTVTAATRKLGR